MKDFHHPNVMTLIGVCLDAGPGVSIVMPFMANGSLLDYLNKERGSLYLSEVGEIDEVHNSKSHTLLPPFVNQLLTVSYPRPQAHSQLFNVARSVKH